MKLTKLQRHTAYILMLSEANLINKGLCVICNNTFNGDEIDGTIGCYWIVDYLPELAKRLSRINDNWKSVSIFNLDKDGMERRKEILNQCIKETA